MSGHTTMGSHQIRMVAQLADKIRIARGMSQKEAQKELGWRHKGQWAEFVRGNIMSKKMENDLRIWILRHAGSLSPKGEGS